ncbi:endoplasmic reticulum membrane-associated RNA degradation protein-like isoform X2 [Oratosquilla oratoria]|uniref:endoplasmic reticulum membrane-associated RNA degradation protein-like isoform X2 n=1 Tax=Oratosquilla oratoria TaxID=337810 RepID=UPI003F7665EE
MANHSTFLSPEIKYLIDFVVRSAVEEDLKKEKRNGQWLSADFNLNWDHVEKVLGTVHLDSKEWFRSAIKGLTPGFSEIYCKMKALSSETYERKLQPFLQWTHDVLLLKTRKIPFLIKDLLAHPEITSLLGEKQAVILIILMGSVLGINIRNLAWHGFLAGDEAHAVFVYITVIMLVECGKTLHHLGKKTIPERSKIEFSVAPTLDISGEELHGINHAKRIINYSSLLPVVHLHFWNSAIDLLQEKRWGWAVSLMLPLLETAMRIIFTEVNGCPDRVLTAENSVLYTTFNEILSDTYEQQEAEVSEETFDDIETVESQHEVSVAENETSGVQNVSENEIARLKNHISTVTGTKLLVMLQDLLNFIDGPRVRDRISHGECDITSFPRDLALHILYVSVLVLTRGKRTYQETMKKNTDYGVSLASNLDRSLSIGEWFGVEQNIQRNLSEVTHEDEYSVAESSNSDAAKFLEELEKGERTYRCLFHPIALFHQSLIKVFEMLEDWKDWKKPDQNDLEYLCQFSDVPSTFSYPPLSLHHSLCSIHEISKCKARCKSIEYNVLYRPRLEIEIASLFQRICINMQNTIENLKNNLEEKLHMFENKMLRSRQRVTYVRQLKCVPVIVKSCYLTLQILLAHLCFMENLSKLKECEVSSLRKIFKSLLQVYENLSLFTKLSVNKWDEASSLSEKAMNIIQNFYDMK